MKKILLKNFISINILLSSIMANEIVLENSVDKKLDFYKGLIPKHLMIPEHEIKRVISQNNVFANKFLTSEKKLKTLVLIEKFLAKEYEKSIFDNLKIDNKILKSYYITHQDKYVKKNVYDFYIFEFSDLNEAQKFKKENSNFDSNKNYIKDFKSLKIYKYSRISTKNVPDIYKLHFKTLKKNELSDILSFGEINSIVTYTSFDKEIKLDFKEVKNNIKFTLFKIKKQKILNSELNKISK